MNKEVLIICESIYHGNTKKLADAMAFRLECDVVGFDEALQMDLSVFKVIGLGSGIYFQKHHPKLFDVVEKMSKDQKAFVFSTRGNPKLGKYHQPIIKQLNNKDIKVCGEFSTKGYDRTGPFVIVNGGNKGRPHEADLMKAEHFVLNILPQYVFLQKQTPKGRNVFVHNECVGCGKCAKICPMQVFEMSEGRANVINEIDCTHCNLCVMSCKKHAISIKHSKKELIQIAIRHRKKEGLSKVLFKPKQD